MDSFESDTEVRIQIDCVENMIANYSTLCGRDSQRVQDLIAKRDALRQKLPFRERCPQ